KYRTIDKMIQISCALLGKAGTGKTSLMERHDTGRFVEQYKANHECRQYGVSFSSNLGMVRFIVWDGVSLADTRSLKLDCAIIMTDSSSCPAYAEVLAIKNQLLANFEEIPLAICCNKMDLSNVMSLNLKDMRDNITFFNMSVKNNVNCIVPFNWLACKVLNFSFLKFTTQIAVDPPNAPLSTLNTTAIRFQLSLIPLPEDDNNW
ncbi:hypothetical protein KR044_011086, partial [Drosophila immigrans]